MTYKLKPVALLIVCIIIIIAIDISVWFFTTEDKQLASVTADIEATGETQKEESAGVTNFKYSEPELREMVIKTAREQFGDDSFIIFLSSEGPTRVEIHGLERNIYIYAADSRSAHDETGEIRGLYHIDADTGEIFDNGNGNMEKIKTGE